MASTAAEAPKGDDDQAAWWSDVLRWIAYSLVLPCKPIILPLLPCAQGSTVGPTVTGTILCPQDNGDNKKKVRLCFQEGGPAGPPILLLDLPISTCELAGACRIALECERARAGGGPLLGAATWAVYCNGRRAGFGSRREATEADAWALEAMWAMSAGAGILPARTSDGGGGGGLKYLRGRFERVVGSADSESYHLVDPTGCLGQELSFFFLRI